LEFLCKLGLFLKFAENYLIILEIAITIIISTLAQYKEYKILDTSSGGAGSPNEQILSVVSKTQSSDNRFVNQSYR
jgi:hypothetical protein